MALTRKALKAMGLADEQVESIIEMHLETVNGLKEEAAQYAEQIPQLQKDLDEANQKLSESDKDGWRVKHDALLDEFNSYKADIESQQRQAAKESAYREMLKALGIPEKRLDAIIRITDLSSFELGEDGKFKDAAAISESAKTDWSDFIEQADQAKPGSPRIDTGGNLSPGKPTRTREEILQIKDTSERQQAWAEYLKNEKGS